MKKHFFDPELLRKYHHDDELSVLEISRRLNVDRLVIYRIMNQAGIPTRGQSEANKIRMQREGATGRARLTQAAHAAVRGVRLGLEAKATRARGLQVRGKSTAIERIFLEEFNDLGYFPIPQYAVSAFNIDLAFPDQRIAIEVDPGHWHSTPMKVRKDAEKNALLQTLGWSVIRFYGHKVRLSNPNLRQDVRKMLEKFHAASAFSTSPCSPGMGSGNIPSVHRHPI